MLRNALLYKYYHIVLAYAVSIRVTLLLPIVVLCLVYGLFVPAPEGTNINTTWAVVLISGFILYSLSMLLDVFVVLFKQQIIKYKLVTVARMFRIITYFYVGATVCNFTYRSYMSVGFSPALHVLTGATMLCLVGLIAFHAFQCREGLSYGGTLSEKPTW